MYFDIGHGRRRSRYVIGHIASWSLEAKHFNHCRTRWQQPTVVAGIREFCFLCFISFSYNSASWITLISSIINCFIAVGNHANAIKNICIKFCQRFSNHCRWQPGNFQNQGVCFVCSFLCFALGSTGSPASSSVSCLAGFCVFLQNLFFGHSASGLQLCLPVMFGSFTSSFIRINASHPLFNQFIQYCNWSEQGWE